MATQCGLGRARRGGPHPFPVFGRALPTTYPVANAHKVDADIIGKSTRSWCVRTDARFGRARSGRRAEYQRQTSLPVTSREWRRSAVEDSGAAGSLNPADYMMALLFVAIGLAAAELIQPMFGGIENVDMGPDSRGDVAARFGLWPFAAGELALAVLNSSSPPVYNSPSRSNNMRRALLHADRAVVSNVAARVSSQARSAIGRGFAHTESLSASAAGWPAPRARRRGWATAYQTAADAESAGGVAVPEEAC